MGDLTHLEKMGRELKCPICLSLLSSSVSLTCNHVFCNSCITKSMKSGSCCPVCKVPFQRREVRAAPHMDSLVNIYKNMEAASGFQIHVTQNPSSTKLPDENNQVNDDTTCGREDTNSVGQDRAKNQRNSKRKRAGKSNESNHRVSSIAAKPSFPTKKRVQVPQCLLSETPNRSEKLEGKSSENIEGGLKDSSLAPKESPVSERKGEHGLTPFFWLRDDEGSQKLSQQGDDSQHLEITPPYIPTFSDIKDSDDDGSPTKLSLPEQTRGKSNDVEVFDSEMFEWTQRPCSPELFSSPVKMQDTIEAPTQSLNANDYSEIKEKEHKSNKRGKTASRKALKRCLKKDSGQDPLSLKKQKQNSTGKSIMEETNAMNAQMREELIPSKVSDKKISNIKEKRPKQGKQLCPASRLKGNKSSVHKKNAKVSFNVTSEDELMDAQQEIHNNMSAKKSEFTAKALKVTTKETKSTGQIESGFGSKTFENSEASLQENQSKGSALRACQKINHKIQCAFCHSSEDTEVSGEMVHYSNGRPVAVNFTGEPEVIHVHRYCAEWAPNVYFEDDIAINLKAELSRSKKIVCCCCGLKGAALGCYEKSCRKSFHVTCAKMTPQCRWDTDNFVMLCPLHASIKLPNEASNSQGRKRKMHTREKKTTQQSNQVVTKHDSSANQSWNSHEKLNKLVICCSALTVEEREIVSQFQQLSGANVLKNWDLRVTHVIASVDENGACRRTLKFLMGILEGKWILNIEWVKACIEAKKIVQEEPFEIQRDIHGIKNGPQLGRLRIANKKLKLFEGLKFYLMKDFPDSYKGYIQDIVVAGGGNILNRKPINGVKEDSTFVIYSLEISEKCGLCKKDTVLNQRKSAAEALANATGAKAVSNVLVLNSVAACKMLV